MGQPRPLRVSVLASGLPLVGWVVFVLEAFRVVAQARI